MSKLTRRQLQSGNTLAITLVLILVAAGVTLTSMRGSLMQEKMVANQSNKAASFMAAESGASSFIKWVKDPNTTWASDTWQNTIPTTAAGSQNLGTKGYYWINPTDVTWGANSVTLKIRGYAKSDSSATPTARTTLKLTVTKPSSGSGTNIGSGLRSGGNIDINGNADIIGSAYANGNFSVSGGNNSLTNGEIDAGGTAKMNGVASNLLTSGADTAPVAAITDAWLAQMSAAASVKSCNLSLSGDQSGKIYYCDGNATVSGDFSNATIVASGNVIKSGSGQLGGSGKSSTAVTVAIAAKGNITFNGNSTDYSVFWANGNYTHNGSGDIKGSMTIGGNITRNGKFSFEEITNVQNDQIATSPTGTSRVALWQEILE